MGLILRWVLNAVFLLLADLIVGGFIVEGLYAALIFALVLGLLNAVVRPLLFLLTLPVTILTLGLFTFVLNAFMIWLGSTMVKGIEIEGFIPAILVALILWIGGWATNVLIREARES